MGGSRIYSFVLVCGEDASSGHQGGQSRQAKDSPAIWTSKSGRHQRAPPSRDNKLGSRNCLCWCWPGHPSQGLGALGLGLELGGTSRKDAELTACAGWSSEGPCDKMHRGKKVNRPSLATSGNWKTSWRRQRIQDKTTTSNID